MLPREHSDLTFFPKVLSLCLERQEERDRYASLGGWKADPGWRRTCQLSSSVCPPLCPLITHIPQVCESTCKEKCRGGYLASQNQVLRSHYHSHQIFLSPLESMLTLKGIFSASSDPSHSPSCIWTPWWLSAQWRPAWSTFESSPEGRETARGPPQRRGLNRDTRSTHTCLGYLQRRSATCRNKAKSVMSGQASRGSPHSSRTANYPTLALWLTKWPEWSKAGGRPELHSCAGALAFSRSSKRSKGMAGGCEQGWWKKCSLHLLLQGFGLAFPHPLIEEVAWETWICSWTKQAQEVIVSNASSNSPYRRIHPIDSRLLQSLVLITLNLPQKPVALGRGLQRSGPRLSCTLLPASWAWIFPYQFCLTRAPNKDLAS